jgi:hypothetical protein
MNPLVPFFLRPLTILKFYEGSKEDQKEHITWRTSMSMKATLQMELFHLVHAHLRKLLNSIAISNLAAQKYLQPPYTSFLYKFRKGGCPRLEILRLAM